MEFHFFPLFTLLQETASDDAGGLHRSPPGGSGRLGLGVPGEACQERQRRRARVAPNAQHSKLWNLGRKAPAWVLRCPRRKVDLQRRAIPALCPEPHQQNGLQNRTWEGGKPESDLDCKVAGLTV